MLKDTFWYDCLITAVFVTSTCYFILAARGGSLLRTAGFTQGVLDDKMGNLRGAVESMLVGVLLILGRAMMNGEHNQGSVVHYLAVGVLVASFVAMRFFVTGVRYPRAHRRLAAICCFSFATALITGLAQLWLG